MSMITSITETEFGGGKNNTYAGFVISMADGTEVRMGIGQFQDCCENWGYLMSQDDFEDFIGSEFISVAVTDAELKHYDVSGVYDGSAMFINISTSAGMLQFVAYNEHNGYYSHEAVLVENGIPTHSEYL